MDCISVIDGPELSKKNVEISTICYLKNFNLIAVGTDVGRVFFWDLNRSIYLKNDYEVYFRHKSLISSIISTSSLEGKENMISAGHDGLILIWEIECDESKENKKNSRRDSDLKSSYDSIHMKNSSSMSKIDETILPKIETKAPIKIKTFYNIKYLPQIKSVINISNLLSQLEMHYNMDEKANRNSVINTNRIDIKTIGTRIEVIGYTELTKDLIYSGGSDCHIHIWNFEKNSHFKSLQGHKSPVCCMTFDKNYLFTGASDGQILVWNTFDQSLLMTLGEQCNVKIFDIMMMPKFGILVSISNDKKISFWRYESKELIKTIIRKQECLCLTIVNSYGKLLCGTKDKSIFEIDLTEILGSLNIQHDYKKFHFVEDEINYEKDESKLIFFKYFKLGDNNIDNFKIMNSLNNRIHI